MSVRLHAFTSLTISFGLSTGEPTDENQDYAKAYTFLGANLTSSMTQEQFITQAKSRDAAEGIVSRVQTIAPNFASNPAEDVIVTATRSHGTSYTVHLQVRQVGNEWKITAFDGI